MKIPTGVGMGTLLLMLGLLSGCSSGNSTVEDKPPKKQNDVAPEHSYFHVAEQPPIAKWSYEGETGPEHWGDLSPEYSQAKSGKRQSPIDIDAAINSSLPNLELRYGKLHVRMVYTGYTLEEIADAGASLTVGSKVFELKQFHFHAPSEHTLAGEHFPMEMHFVHRSKSGDVAVVAVFVQDIKEHPAISQLVERLPTIKNDVGAQPLEIDVNSLLPTERGYFHYTGSFTTPPCHEGVKWYLLREPVAFSKQQVERLRAVIGKNNRPSQPLNDREVVASE